MRAGAAAAAGLALGSTAAPVQSVEAAFRQAFGSGPVNCSDYRNNVLQNTVIFDQDNFCTDMPHAHIRVQNRSWNNWCSVGEEKGDNGEPAGYPLGWTWYELYKNAVMADPSPNKLSPQVVRGIAIDEVKANCQNMDTLAQRMANVDHWCGTTIRKPDWVVAMTYDSEPSAVGAVISRLKPTWHPGKLWWFAEMYAGCYFGGGDFGLGTMRNLIDAMAAGDVHGYTIYGFNYSNDSRYNYCSSYNVYGANNVDRAGVKNTWRLIVDHIRSKGNPFGYGTWGWPSALSKADMEEIFQYAGA